MKYVVNGIQLNVVEQGSGPLTLIFMHYFGGSSLEWQMVMNQLANQYRCVAFDLRGHGDSDAPVTDYSVNTMAGDVAELVKVLEIQDFILVGHSMSGKVALAFASRQPVGLRALLLVAPSPPLPEPIPDDDRQQLLDGYGQWSAAEQTAEKITVRPVSVEAKEQIIADNLRTAKPAWDAWLMSGSREDITDRMPMIRVPVSIIAGLEDKALSSDVQPKMTLPYLKNATFDTVPDAGHLLPWETPNQLVNFIQKKISALSSK
jgi:pimeloyl-ACP methyl ester carboxylesterase